MESVNYKSIEEANSLLSQDDLPSSNPKAPPSPQPQTRSPSKEKGDQDSSSSPLKAKSEKDSTIMDCGLKKLVVIGALCRKYSSIHWPLRNMA